MSHSAPSGGPSSEPVEPGLALRDDASRQELGRWRSGLLLLLFFLSGAAALIYEVLWLKQLGRLFGVTSYAAATTLAVFFLGLAAGGWVWGRRAQRLRNPLRAYALLEVGIALSALMYFLLFDLYRWIHTPLFAAIGYRPTLSLLVKSLLSMGILFLPAFFMGGTLPVMAQFLVRRAEQLGRKATLLYALNTVGAASGALLAGFFLPRYLGFRSSYFVAIALNLVIAAITFAWSRRRPAAAAPAEPLPELAATVERTATVSTRLIWFAAFLSGFVTLALEVLWTRMFAQVLQNSVYSFTVILVVFLFALALGSAVANFLCRRRWSSPHVLFGLASLSGLLVGLTPLVFYHATRGLQTFGTDLGWSGYVTSIFGLAALVLLLPTLVMGSLFPYLMKLSESRMTSAGRTVGQLAAVNTGAAILGSLLAGFLLLSTVGLWASVRLMAMLYFGLAIFSAPGPGRVRWRLRSLPLLGLALFTWGLTYSDFALVHLDSSRNEEYVDSWEGAHGTVVVVSGDSGLGIKVNNTYQLGTSKSAINVRIQSWLPLALHPDPRSVFFLGMGTGLSASGALDFPVERIVVSELNHDVIRASRRHFRPYLNGLFEDPRVSVYPEDGRTYLLGTQERFDVIIADVFLTYKAGVGSLYTLEHFETVRSRLAPGGIFVQWLPLLDMSEEEFGIVTRTLLEVFPQVTLWRRGFSPKFTIFALIAGSEPSVVDPDLLRQRLDRLEERGALPKNVWLRSIPFAAYAGNLGALRSRFERYPVSTDDRTPLEYLAPITDRDRAGARQTPVLSWLNLASYCGQLLQRSPPEQDVFLELLEPAEIRQVWAGLEYYRYESFRRLSLHRQAQRALRRYRALVTPALGAGGS